MSTTGLRGHVCLVVDDDAAYAELAAGFLAEAGPHREKSVTIGPHGSPVQDRLRPLAAMAADPYLEVLGRRRLDPERMFAMFRQEAGKAAGEGYRALRVTADMDWLLPAIRCHDDALAFEVQLDRVVAELGATVLCAYKRTSFQPDAILGMLCTHPETRGGGQEPPFSLSFGDDGRWVLSGEVDIATSSVLRPVLGATAGEPWVVDVTGLAFADVSGMRAIVMAARAADRTLHLLGASARLTRHWRLAGFDRAAEWVVLDG